ncbi:uncharacterized protein LOC124637919 [Helicoverpa zea]|uniref:uncharacterized protein LOC124637919 n=1 Tax=Helicoverpa zea TaxID=7113 RepID=UPI001F5784CB|nr:uncharacterized protein LOC124637919 [Helicoverpa zea]
MCIGRENRNKETQIPQKKDKGSCKLKCQRWILSKFERCLRKKIFGHVFPKLADYEFMGMDLESLQDSVTGKTSDKSLNKKVAAANKIKLAKVDMKDIEKIKGISANDLKKRYSIKGSKLKMLEGMVTDYNDGNLSFSQKSRKPSSTKQLTKEQLNEILKDYDTAKKKTVADEIQKNAKDLKKIVKTQSQRQLLDNVLEDLKKESVQSSR